MRHLDNCTEQCSIYICSHFLAILGFSRNRVDDGELLISEYQKIGTGIRTRKIYCSFSQLLARSATLPQYSITLLSWL